MASSDTLVTPVITSVNCLEISPIFPEFFLQGINSFADRGIVFNHVGVRVFYFINLTHGLDFFFNERFLFLSMTKWLRKRHGCQTVFYFLFYWKPVEQVLRFLWFFFFPNIKGSSYSNTTQTIVWFTCWLLYCSPPPTMPRCGPRTAMSFAYVEKYPSFFRRADTGRYSQWIKPGKYGMRPAGSAGVSAVLLLL